MSERKKPSQVSSLRVVAENEAGTVEEITSPVELSPVEELLEAWSGHTFTGSEVVSGIRPRTWLVRDWFPLEAVVAVVAPAKTGKSFYASHFALELARGGNFAGEQLTASKVLYVATEKPTDIRDRLEAWSIYHSRPIPDHFVTFAPRRPPQLTNAAHLAALCEKVRSSNARVVVLDVLARMTLGLDENSSKDMGAVMEALDVIRDATNGGLVVVVHHTGKDPAKGARGSSAFLGALDAQIALEGDTAGLKARVTDTNAAAESLPEWYRVETVHIPAAGDTPPRSVGVMVPTLPRDAGEGRDAELLAVLTESYPEGATLKQIVEALGYSDNEAKQKGSGIGKRLNTLANRGLVEKWGGPKPKPVYFGPGPLLRLEETTD